MGCVGIGGDLKVAGYVTYANAEGQKRQGMVRCGDGIDSGLRGLVFGLGF